MLVSTHFYKTSAVFFLSQNKTFSFIETVEWKSYPARALRALGLLLYSWKGEDFLTGQLNFFAETAVTPGLKVEKSFPRWEINRHAEG